MATINKELLATLGLNIEELDEEVLKGLIIEDEQENEEDETDETPEDENEDDESDTDDDNDDDEDDEELGIDLDKLTPGERMIYGLFEKERARNKKKEINLVVNNAGLSAKHKEVVDLLVKNGANLKDVTKAIENFKEMTNSEKRATGSSIMIPKGKVKTKTIKDKQTKDEKPKIGSPEYGKYMASIRLGKKK